MLGLFKRSKEPAVPEITEQPEPVVQVWDGEKMKHQMEERGFKVTLNPVNFWNLKDGTEKVVIMSDPYDIRPAFDIRYEPVVLPGGLIRLTALRKNAHIVKLQAREVVTDPKRVARRHWHKYQHEARQKRIIQDSRLFI